MRLLFSLFVILGFASSAFSASGEKFSVEFHCEVFLGDVNAAEFQLTSFSSSEAHAHPAQQEITLLDDVAILVKATPRSLQYVVYQISERVLNSVRLIDAGQSVLLPKEDRLHSFTNNFRFGWLANYEKEFSYKGLDYKVDCESWF